MSEAGSQLLALVVGGDRVGVPVQMVREVTRLPRLTPVPHAPEALIGLANVRGAVIPVMSLAQMTRRTAVCEQRLVVMDVGEPVGFAVDAVAELLEADGSIEALDTLALVERRLHAGMVTSRMARGARSVEAHLEETGGSAGVSLVTFAIGRQAFALPLEAVEEVLRLPDDIAAVPHTDPTVLGSVEVRGALLPLLSLPALLALSGDANSARSRVIVTRIGEQRVGLLVDAVQAILRVAERDIDPVPVVLTRGDAEARIQAICRIGGGKLLSVLAPGHLLREELTARLVQATPAVATNLAVESGSEQFVLFKIGGASFGLPIGAVEAVAVVPAKLSRWPRSPAFVRGVMYLRGQAVSVIDQAARFGTKATPGRKQRVVVVRLDGRLAALLVDEISEVRRVPTSELQVAPDLGDGGCRVFERVAVDGDTLTLLLDAREMLDAAEREILVTMSNDVARAL